MSRPPLVERRPMTTALAAFTAITIVAGFGFLGWATTQFQVAPAIALRGFSLPFRDDRVAGVAFWTLLGLVGSMRTRSLGGRGVITFHLPFIVAAMALGGPAAAAWVAVIGSLELRELREVPWFGTLANHAVAVLAAVAGGIVTRFLVPALEPILYETAAAPVALMAGSIVFCAIDLGMSAVTIGLRERLSLSEIPAVIDTSSRKTLVGEVILGWLLAAVFQSVGWWASIACTVLVLIVWQANDEHDRSTHDELTGLLNRRGFQARCDAVLRRARSGQGNAALVMVDLDGFKGINDTYGHAAGDIVLRRTAQRLRAAVRYTDVVARLGGDEFVLIMRGLPGREAAQAIVERVHERLCEPMVVPAGRIGVGASMGLVFLDADASSDSLESADKAMYAAKRTGGGVELGAMA